MYLYFPLQLLWTQTHPSWVNTEPGSVSVWERSPASCPRVKGWTRRWGLASSATWRPAWPKSTPWTSTRLTQVHWDSDRPARRSLLPRVHRCPAKVARRCASPRRPWSCTEASRLCRRRMDSSRFLFPARLSCLWAHKTATTCHLLHLRSPQTLCGDRGRKPAQQSLVEKDYHTIKHIFVHFVNVFKSYLRGMFTHICVFFYMDSRRHSGLFACCDFLCCVFVMAQFICLRGQENPWKALEKHCIFFLRWIKCFYDVYYNMCCSGVSVISLPQIPHQGVHSFRGRWARGYTLTSSQTCFKSFHLTSLEQQPFKCTPHPLLLCVLSTPDHPLCSDRETCFLAGNKYLSNEVRNLRGRVEPKRHAVSAGKRVGQGLLTHAGLRCCQNGHR